MVEVVNNSVVGNIVVDNLFVVNGHIPELTATDDLQWKKKHKNPFPLLGSVQNHPKTTHTYYDAYDF